MADHDFSPKSPFADSFFLGKYKNYAFFLNKKSLTHKVLNKCIIYKSNQVPPLYLHKQLVPCKKYNEEACHPQLNPEGLNTPFHKTQPESEISYKKTAFIHSKPNKKSNRSLVYYRVIK